ncbi:putative metalloprotease CJM1_0395 family protein [Thalassospira sp. NFXS8]|uniref:putative metalloprotease CJM1_0395 family protein n=1 Tax=Thalassospira sp. NFXS8 TaxID=2819093 RepID=UPI0032DFFFAC
MTSIGSIQTIPGSGGKIGEVVAMNGLASTESQGASSGGTSQGGLLPRRMAAVSLVPITSPASKQLPPAAPGATQGLRAQSGQSGTSDGTTLVAGAPAPAPVAQARPAPAISAATITVVQQVDPRSLPGSGATATELPGSAKENRSETPQARSTPAPDGAPDTLSPGARDHVQRLQDRDAAVRAEENSHKALAGANAGMISYNYTVGPDGRLYAEGGHVTIQPLRGLTGIQAIANQVAIGNAASVGTSTADFSAQNGSSANISQMISHQQQTASQSYNQTTAMLFSQQQKTSGLVA